MNVEEGGAVGLRMNRPGLVVNPRLGRTKLAGGGHVGHALIGGAAVRTRAGRADRG
jgi:hypothetical protein